MYIETNYQMCEHNMCPQCMAPFIKYATGLDRGIQCGGCGFVTPIEKYQEVMKQYVGRVFLSKPEEEVILN